LGIGDWLIRLVPGLVSALFFIVAGDWLQTRSLNARRRVENSDDQVQCEVAAPATRVYLSAVESCVDMGWQVHAADDQHFTLWLINRSPHLGLRNIGLILHLTPFGSGETRILLALNSPHPDWVRRRFRAAAPRYLERLRLRALEEPPGSGMPSLSG
jgi:hypothetical protein